VLAKLEHPGIVPVHDLGRTIDGDAFYVMKRVEGQTFAEFCRGPASLPERLRVLLRVCETAAFAHAHGVVHRDLTPGNIMVGAFGEVITLDWGMAHRGDPATPGASDTEARAPRGTPGYAAPEVRSGGAAHVTAVADVFSLGGLVALAVTGHHPRAASDESAAPGDWPRGRRLAPLRAVCHKARHIDPASRYTSVRDLERDLERFLDQQRVEAYEEPWFEAALRVLGKYRFLVALILAYLVLRLALAWWSHRG
jgi:serine/threonine protein kinase